MKVSKNIGYILLSSAVGIAVGGIIGYLSKRYYEKWALDQINISDGKWIEQCSEKNEIIDATIAEIYELRAVLKIMVDQMQCETILEQIKYKMKNIDESSPNVRKLIEKYLDIYSTRQAQFQQNGSAIADGFEEGLKNPDPYTVKQVQVIAEKMTKSLGYSPLRDDPSLTPKERRIFGEEKTNAKLRARLKDAVDSSLAEAEHPMDDGEGEFDDIDDYDEDDKHLWTTDTEIAVSGNDIKRDKPYIISEWQYTYGRQEYEKVNLDYMCLDDTLLDTDGDELDQNIVGSENLLAFETDDCPSIFIRNDQLEIDYEIMWTEASYIHDFLGYPEAQVTGRRIWRSWEDRV